MLPRRCRRERTMSDALLTQHPLSAAFPAMTDAAFAEFRADIAQNGLRQPIIATRTKSSTAGIAIAPAAMSAFRLGSRHFSATRPRR